MLCYKYPKKFLYRFLAIEVHKQVRIPKYCFFCSNVQIFFITPTGSSGEDEKLKPYQKPFVTRFVRNSVTNISVFGRICQSNVALIFNLSIVCHRPEHLSLLEDNN